MPILRHHPQIPFAPGGGGKSLFALALLGELGRQGIRTLLLDWEMDGGEQRTRGDALDLPPTIRYRRCDQPLIVLADSIRRDVIDNRIDFLLIDSIAPACSGRVEDAETAIDFSRPRGGSASAILPSPTPERRTANSVRSAACSGTTSPAPRGS